jgi:hypothetical protein
MKSESNPTAFAEVIHKNGGVEIPVDNDVAS